MNIEYEATFLNINKGEMRKRLKKAGALLVRPEYLQKRVSFHLPKERRAEGTWLRVRDEGNRITLSLKTVNGNKIKNQKELCLEVGDFNDAVKLLELIGCKPKQYQETKRELWKLGNVEITIDEWPFLEPFVEVEGKSEKEVKKVSEKIGFNYSDALFCAVGVLYQLKYGILPEDIHAVTDRLVFNIKNPFLKKL